VRYERVKTQGSWAWEKTQKKIAEKNLRLWTACKETVLKLQHILNKLGDQDINILTEEIL